jgi:hypothetical protein
MEAIQAWGARDTSTTECEVLKVFMVIKHQTYTV